MVVPELKGITIGGAVSGCSIESQSFRYGGFHDSCLEYEAVTGEGELITCSEQENPDVFHLLHGSYGTLARLTRITFKLMPAKPYVKMTYRRFDRFPEYWAELRALCESAEFPFIDGIIHAKDCFVLCLGEMVENPPYVSDYTWLDIFYKSTRSRTEDYLSIYDYFFRYDTECHWLTRTLPLMESKPVRFALGKWLLGSTNLITWSKRLKRVLRLKKRPEVVVDVFIPGRRFEEFYNWYEADFDFYPLWIVPYRMPAIYPWVSDEHAARMNDTFLIDAAVYGKANTPEISRLFRVDGAQGVRVRRRQDLDFTQSLQPGNLLVDLQPTAHPDDETAPRPRQPLRRSVRKVFTGEIRLTVISTRLQMNARPDVGLPIWLISQPVLPNPHLDRRSPTGPSCLNQDLSSYFIDIQPHDWNP